MASFINIRQSNGSFKGLPLIPGKSAYQLAVDDGFAGSISDWLASLRGTGILADTTPPTESQGKIGDFYMQIPSKDDVGIIGFYRKTSATSWQKIGNLISEDDSIIQMLTVDTEEQLNNIDVTKLPTGSMCYVSSLKNYCYLVEGKWMILKDGAFTTVPDYSSLSSLSDNATIVPGTMVFVENENAYYHYDTTNTWQQNRTAVISQEEPTDTSVIWIPENELPQETIEDNITIKDIYAAFKVYDAQMQVLNDRIQSLEKEVAYLKEHGITTDTADDDGAILLEDGNYLISETGDYIIIESASSESTTNDINGAILTEDGNYITTEDDRYIIIEGA